MLKVPRLRLFQSSRRKYQRFFFGANLKPASFNTSLLLLRITRHLHPGASDFNLQSIQDHNAVEYLAQSLEVVDFLRFIIGHSAVEVFQYLIGSVNQLHHIRTRRVSALVELLSGFASAKKVIYLGQNLNGLFAKNWVEENLSVTNAWIFSHVGQILKPWWVNFCGGQLLNMHSAVLPYARGANAVQNVAALKDSVALRKVAGASIHYIDAGVDTGNLIRAERIAKPFQYENLWQLIAAIYNLGDSMYVRLAQDLILNPDANPVGFDVGQGSQGLIYLRKDFTAQKRQDAEQNFLEMRKEWLAAQRK